MNVKFDVKIYFKNICICYVLFVTFRNKVGNKLTYLFCAYAHNLGPKSAIQMLFLKILNLDTKAS